MQVMNRNVTTVVIIRVQGYNSKRKLFKETDCPFSSSFHILVMSVSISILFMEVITCTYPNIDFTNVEAIVMLHTVHTNINLVQILKGALLQEIATTLYKTT